MLDNRMYWVYTHTFLTRDMVRINRVIHSLFVRGDCRSEHKQCDCFLFGSLRLHRWQSKGMTTRLIFHLFVILQSNLNFPSLSEVKISSVLTNQGKGQGRLQLRCVWAVFNIWDHVVFFPPEDECFCQHETLLLVLSHSLPCYCCSCPLDMAAHPWPGPAPTRSPIHPWMITVSENGVYPRAVYTQ